MRVAFAGTAQFAELVLAGLVAEGVVPVAVVTNPDRPRGRHGTPQSPAIKSLADNAGVPALQPERLSAPDSLARLTAHRPDVLVVCAYGQIVAQAMLDVLLTVVVHPSLVPHWRGAAPVERALMAGETDLGVTILRMTAGVDEGPVGDVRKVYVPRDADAGRAYELLAPAAVAGITATLSRIGAGSVAWQPQVGEPSYAEKIASRDRHIDWTLPAVTIVDQVRALSPHIGAVTELVGRRTLVWRAAAGAGAPPQAGRERLVVCAGTGWVDVLELQPAGGRRMSAAEFLRGAGRALAAS